MSYTVDPGEFSEQTEFPALTGVMSSEWPWQASTRRIVDSAVRAVGNVASDYIGMPNTGEYWNNVATNIVTSPVGTGFYLDEVDNISNNEMYQLHDRARNAIACMGGNQDAADWIRGNLGITLWDHQRELVSGPQTKYTIVHGGRQSGKTMTAITMAIYTACNVPGSDILIVPRNETDAQFIMGRMSQMLNTSSIRADIRRRSIHLPSVSGASAITVRLGIQAIWPECTCVFVDDVDLIRQQVIDGIVNLVRANSTCMWGLVCNGDGMKEWIGSMDGSLMTYVNWPTRLNPTITQDQLAGLKGRDGWDAYYEVSTGRMKPIRKKHRCRNV